MANEQSLPFWVSKGKDKHAGVVHLAADGSYRASHWRRPIGSFGTGSEAVAAILAAPPRPARHKAPLRGHDAFIPGWAGLTVPTSGLSVKDKNGKSIGGALPAGDGFDAWSHGDLLGRFATVIEAERAVHLAERQRKKKTPAVVPTYRTSKANR